MWLPPGGHIGKNETPDEAVVREVQEETGLDIELYRKEELVRNKSGNVIAQLAVPFYANVHIAGDHNHACLYYLCATQSDHVMLSKESTGYRWVTPAELADARDIPQDVKSIGTLAFETYKEKQSR